MYWLIAVSYFLMIPASIYWYMPIFYRLQVTSAYEVILSFLKLNRYNDKSLSVTYSIVPISASSTWNCGLIELFDV